MSWKRQFVKKLVGTGLVVAVAFSLMQVGLADSVTIIPEMELEAATGGALPGIVSSGSGAQCYNNSNFGLWYVVDYPYDGVDDYYDCANAGLSASVSGHCSAAFTIIVNGGMGCDRHP